MKLTINDEVYTIGLDGAVLLEGAYLGSIEPRSIVTAVEELSSINIGERSNLLLISLSCTSTIMHGLLYLYSCL